MPNQAVNAGLGPPPIATPITATDPTEFGIPFHMRAANGGPPAGNLNSTWALWFHSVWAKMAGAAAPYFIESETGANNAIAAALPDANVVANVGSAPLISGVYVPLAVGLRVVIKLGHTLQAGANTFSLNGTSKNIRSHRNPANNIATAYAVGGFIELIYDGTQWQDLSQ